MAVTTQSGNTSVTGSVTTSISSIGLISPSAGQTMINVTFDAASTDTVLYTVTAGKTFYCMGYFLSTSTNANIGLKSDGVAVVKGTLSGNTGTSASGNLLFKTAATKNITGHTGVATSLYGSFWGYEV